jgi:hypothetical protein
LALHSRHDRGISSEGGMAAAGTDLTHPHLRLARQLGGRLRRILEFVQLPALSAHVFRRSHCFRWVGIVTHATMGGLYSLSPLRSRTGVRVSLRRPSAPATHCTVHQSNRSNASQTHPVRCIVLGQARSRLGIQPKRPLFN